MFCFNCVSRSVHSRSQGRRRLPVGCGNSADFLTPFGRFDQEDRINTPHHLAKFSRGSFRRQKIGERFHSSDFMESLKNLQVLWVTMVNIGWVHRKKLRFYHILHDSAPQKLCCFQKTWGFYQPNGVDLGKVVTCWCPCW